MSVTFLVVINSQYILEYTSCIVDVLFIILSGLMISQVAHAHGYGNHGDQISQHTVITTHTHNTHI